MNNTFYLDTPSGPILCVDYSCPLMSDRISDEEKINLDRVWAEMKELAKSMNIPPITLEKSLHPIDGCRTV